ncbi:hypothetical protein B0A48_14294 [Cryoendolithus antarcticus]|uniref:Uncharacterized protein n=1 Tax=Cryoendolithus antarcticus TaxID=1507870 RepID=A0A1V8SJK3_9PEZI|nr:hypothetical protein B0A48_14294 [Cryoendolithus antarcticus]
MADTADAAQVGVPGSSGLTTATHNFFGIIELFEIVLLDDSITTEQFFVVQRVNGEFQAFIRGSLRLKRRIGPGPGSPLYSPEHHSMDIANRDIKKASVRGSFDRRQHDGNVKLQVFCGIRNRADPPQSAFAPASWMHIKIANVSLFGTLYCYSARVRKATLDPAVTDYHDLQTLGDVHRIVELLEHRFDHLDLEPAAVCRAMVDDSRTVTVINVDVSVDDEE